MYKAHLSLDETASILVTCEHLRREASLKGLDSYQIDMLVASFQAAFTPIFETAQKLKAQGSQMSVTRNLKDMEYDVKVTFQIGKQRGFWDRLWHSIRGR